MLIDKEMAKKLEVCFLRSHINVTLKSAALGLESDILYVGSGGACFLGKESFLSQVVAWGFDDDLENLRQQLCSIEKFYLKNNYPTINIELSPFCGSEVAQLLSSAGYQVAEFNTISLLELDGYVEKGTNHDVTIPNKANFAKWAKNIAIGFNCPNAWTQFELYAQSKDIIPFQVMVEENMVAGATMAMHDLLCDLGVTSTMPKHRGKGLQKDLIHARLSYAKKRGTKIAVVATEPGSISDLNIQKTGFQRAYTRVKFIKYLGNEGSIIR